MNRHLDRTRNILNLLLLLICFLSYAGHSIKQQDIMPGLAFGIVELTEPDLLLQVQADDSYQEDVDEAVEDILGDSLNELVSLLRDINDLSWISRDEQIITIKSAVGYQNQNKALNDWLESELASNRADGLADQLPDEFVQYFETSKETNKARYIETQLNTRLQYVTEKYGNNITLKEAADKFQSNMKLPVAGFQMEAREVLLVLCYGSTALLIYIFSMLGSIQKEIPFLTERTGTDLILFHPGGLGLLISAAWLLAPAGVCLFWILQVSFLMTTPLIGGVILSIVAALAVLISLIRTRDALDEQLEYLAVNS